MKNIEAEWPVDLIFENPTNVRAALYRDAVARLDDEPIAFDVFDGGPKTFAHLFRRMEARGLKPSDFQV